MDTRRVKAALFGLAIGICGTWMLADSGQDNRAKFTSESQRVEILPQNRPAGRQAVGSRTDRRGDNQAVATIGSHQFCVNVKVHIENRERPAGENAQFVQSQHVVQLLFDGLNHRVFVRPAFPRGGSAFPSQYLPFPVKTTLV
jgi:hypothetical protein